MTPAEFRAAITKLGLSQEEAGRLLGRSGRTGQRWATGKSPIPHTVALLLVLAVRDKKWAALLKRSH